MNIDMRWAFREAVLKQHVATACMETSESPTWQAGLIMIRKHTYHDDQLSQIREMCTMTLTSLVSYTPQAYHISFAWQYWY